MIWLKILPDILAFVSAVLLASQQLIPKLRDMRTTRAKNIRTGLFIILILMPITKLFQTYHERREAEHSRRCIEDAEQRARPSIKISFSESSDTQVVFQVFCQTTNSAPVQDLFFKFDIPGDFLDGVITDKDRVESCHISKSFLASVNKDTIAETVHVHCKSIFPQGFVRGKVTFDKTRIRPIPGSMELGYTNNLYMPLMDLHDYSRCLFSWSHAGSVRMEEFYICFTNLHYIREDNINFIKMFSEKWLREMEEMRKGW